MYSVEETQQMTVLNALMEQGSLIYSDIYQYMFEHYKPDSNSTRDDIRRLCNNLRKYFKEYGIRLFEQTVMGHRYTITEEAREFCFENLHEPIYDEEGEIAGMFFQHPISLTTKRLELI